MRILSIDPGYERLGVAIIERTNNKDVLLYSICKKTSATKEFQDRLSELGSFIDKLILDYSPEILAIEKLYFQNNQKTAMYVSQVIGVTIFLAKKNNMPVYEYTPLQIKSAITGNGRADKKQIITMLKHLIQIDKEIKYDDEFDAIAIGLTHTAYNAS